MARPIRWQLILLMAQPPLSVAYLLAMRSEILPASTVAVAVMAILPAASLAVGVHARRSLDGDQQSWNLMLMGIAVVELLWSAVILAIVEFAHAWRLD